MLRDKRERGILKERRVQKKNGMQRQRKRLERYLDEFEWRMEEYLGGADWPRCNEGRRKKKREGK